MPEDISLSKHLETLHNEVLASIRKIAEKHPWDAVDGSKYFLLDHASLELSQAIQYVRAVEQLPNS